jgi:glycolate oxidase FAD binding subunit
MLIDSLLAILPAEALRLPLPADAADGVLPEYVVEPSTEAELARTLSYANASGLQVAPRGHGTKLDWGNTPVKGDLAISTTRLNRVLEHAHHDMTATVEAGITFAELQRLLAQHGQRIALDPLCPERATIGGIIATNDSGPLRIRFGSVRDLIIGITVALADGTIANSGGKVVKNVAGYDLPKLMTGAFGTLGIITRAVFRLHPLPQQTRSLSIVFPTAAAANWFMLAVADSVLVPTGLQMRVGNGSDVEVDLRFEGVAESVDAQIEAAMKLAGDGNPHSSSGDVWQSREALWRDAQSAVVCKLSMLPSHISEVADSIARTIPANAPWRLVAQSVGLALVRFDLTDIGSAADFIASLRAKLVSGGGSLVVLHCAPELKRGVSVWGEPGNAHALMKRIKERFDPNGILNRGRFVGGI